MRTRQERFLVTFPSTTAAMAMEGICRAGDVPGRLIPVPRAITAGCGLCWSAPLEERQRIEDLLIRERLDVDGLYTMWL